MPHPDDTALCTWLARFQRLDMSESQVESPAKTAAAFARTIGEAARGLSFDTDPATFNQHLHALAPAYLKDGTAE